MNNEPKGTTHVNSNACPFFPSDRPFKHFNACDMEKDAHGPTSEYIKQSDESEEKLHVDS